jgi:hypothetical protein
VNSIFLPQKNLGANSKVKWETKYTPCLKETKPSHHHCIKLIGQGTDQFHEYRNKYSLKVLGYIGLRVSKVSSFRHWSWEKQKSDEIHFIVLPSFSRFPFLPLWVRNNVHIPFQLSRTKYISCGLVVAVNVFVERRQAGSRETTPACPPSTWVLQNTV